MTYKAVSGTKHAEVRIVDCPVRSLLIDNLVRLRYHNDPKPGEHRSQQLCTLPITIRAIPEDEEQLASWHTDACNQVADCICKKEIKYESKDANLPLELLEKEEEVLQRYKMLCCYGMSALWIPLSEHPRTHLLPMNPEQFEDSSSVSDTEDTAVMTRFVDDGDLELSLTSMLISSDTDSEQSSESDCGEFMSDLQIDQDNPAEAIEQEEIDLVGLLQDCVSTHADHQDKDIEEFVTRLQAQERLYSDDLVSHLAGIIHELSKSDKAENVDTEKEMEHTLHSLRFRQFVPPAQLTRHPPPAIGRDDSIEKLKEILDEVMCKSDHRGDLGHRMIFAPDHKIGANLLRLKMSDERKYSSILPEFPVLHLRKSKITNLFAAYKDLGILHLIMYMRDTEDQEWAKLI